jgi:hypothetical protein
MGARNDSRARLRRLRAAARALLWAERLLAAVTPAAILVGAYLALALFRLANGWLCLAAFALGVALLGRGLARLRAPQASDADRRLEAASGLRHRPLAALEDRAALGDEAMFAAHQARMRAAIDAARTGGLAPVLADADPFSLRAAGLLVLIAGLVAAGAAAPQRLAAAFLLPDWPFPGPLVEAWVTPPVTVLTGAHLGVILSGSTARVAFAGEPLAGPAPADNSRRADGTITASGRLTVGPWWHRLAAWDITAVQPTAPRLSLAPPALKSGVLRLSYDAEDDYGLARLGVALMPVGAPGALPDGADLPAQTGAATALLNEAESPYAGLAVAITLRAENLAGITAVTPGLVFTLPARPLHDTTARALAQLRQNLALHPSGPVMAGAALAALSRDPPSAISYAADLQMAALAAALRSQEARPADAVDRLAALIRQIEAGPSYGANQALAAAARALTDTLKQGGSQAELDAALHRFAQALAAKLGAGGLAQTGGQSFDTDSLARAAAQIAADERAGNTAKVQQELAQLEKTLQQLQNARVMTPAEQKRAQAAAAAQGTLAKLIQGQGQQLDKTAQGTATPAAQGALRDQLGALQQGLAKAGLSHIPGMGAAGQSMGQAQQGLAQGQNDTAAGAEAQAIAQMQQAASALQNAAGTSVSFGNGQPADQMGVNGSDEDQSIPGLDLDQSSPARKIQQDIMHRDANPALAPGTHAYLHRLLNP